MVANTHVAFEAYPMFSVNAGTPSGNLALGTNTLVAIFDVTAVGDEDITFVSGTSANKIAFDVSQSINTSDGSANTYTLRDDSGDTLGTASVDDVSDATAEFTFSGTFTVPAGGTKQLRMYADTTEHNEDGDSIQISLSRDVAAGKFTWSIDNDGGQYEYGDIIFRGASGDISANSLVNPS